MEMSYNSSVQTKAGVENILKGTFMDKSVTVTAEREDTSVKAKIDGSNIWVAPGTKNSEVASSLKIYNYKVINSESKSVSKDSNAGTGYVFTNTGNNTSYTMIVLGDVNGDGEVKATDYMKIKNYIMGVSKLTDIEKVAADVNNDNNIKATDYMKIKNYIMGTSTIDIN